MSEYDYAIEILENKIENDKFELGLRDVSQKRRRELKSNITQLESAIKRLKEL